MAFHIFTTKRVSCFGQYDGIDDLIPCKLRGDKSAVFQQLLVDEFHSSAVFKFLDPLFVRHVRIAEYCFRHWLDEGRHLRGSGLTVEISPLFHFRIAA